MNTFVKSLTAVTVLSLPGVAIAQSTDAAYCKALSVSYHASSRDGRLTLAARSLCSSSRTKGSDGNGKGSGSQVWS